MILLLFFAMDSSIFSTRSMSCVARVCVSACCVCLLVRISLSAVSSTLEQVVRMSFFLSGLLPSSFCSSSFQNDGLARMMLWGLYRWLYSSRVVMMVL